MSSQVRYFVSLCWRKEIHVPVSWFLIWTRNCLDCKCPHNHINYRIRGAFISMGCSSARMDWWTNCNSHVRSCNMLYFISTSRLLQVRWSHIWKEKLYLHGGRSIQSWWCKGQDMWPNPVLQSFRNHGWIHYCNICKHDVSRIWLKLVCMF